MQKHFAVFLVIFVFFQNCQASQAESEKFVDTTYVAAERTVKLILDRLISILPSYAKKYADAGNFSVVTAPDYGAYAQISTGQVVIPLGIVMETRFVFWAYQDINDNLSLKAKFPQYLTYLANRMQHMRANNTDEPLKTFAQWNGHAQKVLSSSEQSERLNQDVGHLVDALSFVVAHELAHLVLEHKDASTISGSKSRQQENDADLRAIRWVQEAGFDPIPAAQVLIRLGAEQVSPSNQLIHYKTHDHPLCRLWLRFAPVISRRRNEPAINEGAIKAGFQSAGDMVVQMAVFKEACVN